jgi:hypothetical protein
MAEKSEMTEDLKKTKMDKDKTIIVHGTRLAECPFSPDDEFIVTWDNEKIILTCNKSDK